jgi:hypothetical protein
MVGVVVAVGIIVVIQDLTLVEVLITIIIDHHIQVLAEVLHLEVVHLQVVEAVLL